MVEAVEYWKQGEKLYLPGDLEAEARQRQSEYTDNDTDELQAVLLSYLNTKLPTDWGSWDLLRRRAWLKIPTHLVRMG